MADGRVPSSPTATAWPGWLIGWALAAGFVWSYWPTCEDLWAFWQKSPDYSAGLLVPLVAAYVVWSHRASLGSLTTRTCWWGLGVILLAQSVRILGVFYIYGSLERYSLWLTVVGVVLFLWGVPTVRRLIWVFAFLLLMVPLPVRVHNMVSLPLQSFATSSVVFGLEVLGYLVVREGNVLRLSDQTTIAVAEACSGLRMLTAFIMVAGTLAFLIKRSPWQRTVVVLSSIPVAILANSLRLVATAILYESSGSQTMEKFLHDFAGLVMMPLAVVLMAGEVWVLKWISARVELERPSLESSIPPARQVRRGAQHA